MIDGLKPYPEYKESALPWINRTPVDWRIRRLKSCAERFYSGGTPESGNDRYYCHPSVGIPWLMISDMTRQRRVTVTNKAITEAGRASRRLELLPRGTLLFSMYASLGTVSLLQIDATVNQAIIGIRLKPSEVIPDFGLFYLEYQKPEVVRMASASTQANLNAEKVRTLPILLPPLEDQECIVRFLDHAGGRVERAIRAKKKLIALLHEQKQAIIHRAVTRGLDPTVPLKPSGIPWLGDIPQHWEVRRAKYIFREVDERSRTGSEELLSVSHLTGVTPRSEKNITMFKASSYVGHKLCRPRDLVVNTMWAWMGALGVSARTGIISPAYAVYRPRDPDGLVGDYVDGLLRTRPYVSNIICRSTGLRLSRLRLYPDEFFRLPILLPPTDEQKRIVDQIAIETAKLNTAIARTEREIALLREYRTRLIADVVTGKLDVREAARHLPTEATEATAPTEGSDEEAELEPEESTP